MDFLDFFVLKLFFICDMMNFIFCHSAMATASKKSWAALAAKPAVPEKPRFVPQEHTSVHRKDGQPLPPYHPLEKLFSKTKKPIDTLHYQVKIGRAHV